MLEHLLLRPPSIPSHWVVVALAGVLGRLVLPTLLWPPMLERARAVLLDNPSSFLSASMVV